MSATVSQTKISAGKKHLEIMLPDTRGVTISPFGKGNLKLGPNVVTYSKVAGKTCPGASPSCLQFCYAMRIQGPVRDVYERNTAAGGIVPDLPPGTEIVRLHVSGDFDSVHYIERWTDIVRANPDTAFWAYTRSWNVPELLPTLEKLRALPNMQLFASTDESMPLPPSGWRVAWIAGDSRAPVARNLVCPEETGKKSNCEECRYCFRGRLGDVTFLKH